MQSGQTACNKWQKLIDRRIKFSKNNVLKQIIHLTVVTRLVAHLVGTLQQLLIAHQFRGDRRHVVIT